MNATLVILAIGFVVWLVSTIYKNAEDAKRRQELERPRAPRAGGGNASTDIDRFLEEIQRRRQQQQVAARPVPERPRPIPAALIEKPAPRPQPRPVAPARPVPARPVAQARPTPMRPVPARPLESPRPARALTAFLAEEPVVLITPPPTYEAYATPTRDEKVHRIQGESKNPAPHTADLIRMLHSHMGIKQAILVGMVLGPPRCRQAPGAKMI